MIHIGIDFSLNSPGACVETADGKYHFITFFNYWNRIWDEEGRKIPKAFSVHKELMDDDAILGFPYNRQVTSKEFLPRERQKLEDAGNISSLMVNIFSTLFDGDNVNVALEAIVKINESMTTNNSTSVKPLCSFFFNMSFSLQFIVTIYNLNLFCKKSR